MTQHSSRSKDTPQPDFPSDVELRRRWYLYAAGQSGSVESLLAILRLRQGQSVEEQQAHFEINPGDFLRLQSLRLPRPAQFAADAERIASACHIGKPFEFVQALLLARSMEMAGHPATSDWHDDERNYEAAYDAFELVDEPEDGK